MEQKTESEMEYKQEQLIAKCDCPVCGGRCPRCNVLGCGLCANCKHTRCPLCPQCTAVLEGYDSNEKQSIIPKSRFNMTFERGILLLILALISYIAWKHYKE